MVSGSNTVAGFLSKALLCRLSSCFMTLGSFKSLGACTLLTCCAMLSYTSCRKMDAQHRNALLSQGSAPQKFFQGQAADPLVEKIKQKIFRQEQEKPFISDFVSWAAFRYGIRRLHHRALLAAHVPKAAACKSFTFHFRKILPPASQQSFWL